ncbi:MAG: HutD family protein, partial [Polyangiaceae bacterium]
DRKKILDEPGKPPFLVHRARWVTQPWKNGRGVTHEVWRWIAPEREHPDDSVFDLRVSVAEIDGPQPFSLFPGIDRVLIPLEDNALALQIGGVMRPMTKHHVFRFEGEATAATEGEGRASDLNVMWPRAREARVELGTKESSGDSRALAVFALERTSLRDAHGNETTLEAHDLLVHTLHAGVGYSADLPAVWIRF